MTTGAVSRMLDRMERERLVRREHSPDDRRRISVHALPDRFGELDTIYEPMLRWFNEQVGAFTDRQLRFLVQFVRQGREQNVRETIQLRRLGRPHATRRAGRS